MPEFAAKQPKALCCGAVKTETERNMLLENVEKYMIWLFFYSVVGWIYESTLCSVRAHKFINRGFLNGPYCPIYGWGAVLDILILGKVQNPVLLFFLGAIVTCSLEYFTSYIMEKLFHARWWDYSKRKFNINGRVCLLGAVALLKHLRLPGPPGDQTIESKNADWWLLLLPSKSFGVDHL